MALASVLLAGLTATMAPLASAGTIGIDNGSLIVGTEAGDGGQTITASINGTDILFSSLSFDIVTPGCTGTGDISCALSDFNQLVILGGNGDDAISLGAIVTPPPFSTLILGGPGADVLVGTAGDDTIFGDTGDDVLIGGSGFNCLDGGPGNNTLIGGGPCNLVEPVITPLPRAVTAAPEPGGLFLLATGLVALSLKRHSVRRRRNVHEN